jgi:hypothetical protein
MYRKCPKKVLESLQALLSRMIGKLRGGGECSNKFGDRQSAFPRVYPAVFIGCQIRQSANRKQGNVLGIIPSVSRRYQEI